ncbi:MAG: helix-turn-helix domain containing protein [Sphingomonas fennica]
MLTLQTMFTPPADDVSNAMATDLRARLLDAAIALMDEGTDPTLRAVARRAGVSPMAPYRHFADRAALIDATATSGLYMLKADLRGSAATDLSGRLSGIVRFAVNRPAVARLICETPAGRDGLADLLTPSAGAAAGRTTALALAIGFIRLTLAGNGAAAAAAAAAMGAGQVRRDAAGGDDA